MVGDHPLLPTPYCLLLTAIRAGHHYPHLIPFYFLAIDKRVLFKNNLETGFLQIAKGEWKTKFMPALLFFARKFSSLFRNRFTDYQPATRLKRKRNVLQYFVMLLHFMKYRRRGYLLCIRVASRWLQPFARSRDLSRRSLNKHSSTDPGNRHE